MRWRSHTRYFAGNVAEVTSQQIDSWLSSLNEASGRTRNNYRAALITLFAFARQKGYLPRGQETEAEFASRYSGKGGEIGIYTPAQLNILLSEIDLRFVPFVATGAFAGLRTTEIVRLEWPEVRFEQDVIEIKAAKAKTASRRLVPILPVLRQWLEPFRRKNGRVLVRVLDEFAQATQFRKAVSAIRDENEEPRIKIVPNGLRHSFITYRLASIKNAAEVTLEAGNSPRIWRTAWHL
jgi:integrase